MHYLEQLVAAIYKEVDDDWDFTIIAKEGEPAYVIASKNNGEQRIYRQDWEGSNLIRISV